MREFVTAAREIEEEEHGEEPIEFKVDGVLCRAYRPEGGQLAVLVASTGRHSSTEESVAGFINFFVSVLDDDSHSYIVAKLLDRKDPFGLNELNEISQYLQEEWSGRPIRSSNGSTPSRKKTGRSSTVKGQVVAST